MSAETFRKPTTTTDSHLERRVSQLAPTYFADDRTNAFLKAFAGMQSFLITHNPTITPIGGCKMNSNVAVNRLYCHAYGTGK
jgi:hypothetical protein